MDDETDRLNNLCADLVSLRRLEPGLIRLFRDGPPGEWVPVGELYHAAGAADGSIKSELVAAWLPAPFGNSDYAVVLFYDDGTQWSLTASYHVARLLHGAGQGDR